MANSRAAQKPPTKLHIIVVKGLTSAEVAELDALTERRTGDLRSSGGKASRNAIIVAALRSLIANDRARAARVRR
jgi:hypothetical protein